MSQAQKRAEEIATGRREMASQISPKLEEIRKNWDETAEIFRQHGHDIASQVVPWPDAPTLHRAVSLT